MSNLIIKELDKNDIYAANSNSMSGTRGDISAHDYHIYVDKILNWNISDEKKQKLLDKLYEKLSTILSHEARHVPMMVAGPAQYNAKKLDHSDKILSLSSDFCKWFEDLERQIEQSSRETNDIQRLVEMAEFCDSKPELRPDSSLVKLAVLAPDKFAELFEKYQPKYKWRKNSNLYKAYEAAKSGKLVQKKRETFFEDANFTAYKFGDRAFIKFVMRPQRQLIIAE